MGYHPYLPIASARVNVLCVPAGPITSDRFQKFVKLLQKSPIVRLKVVESAQASQGPSC